MATQSPFSRISPDQQAERQKIFEYVQHSLRLEGFELSAEAQALFARYVHGELTRPELNREVDRLARSH
jgi:hypothetical protein